MTENKKTFKVEGVEKFSFMVFVRKKHDGTTFYSAGCASDMVAPLPEKVAKCIEKSGQKWLDVWFVKKNRYEVVKGLEPIEHKKKYVIEYINKVWLTKNERGYLGFIVDCDPETIFPCVEKEAKKDEPKQDLDDLPF